jgi:hypothetical protein
VISSERGEFLGCVVARHNWLVCVTESSAKLNELFVLIHFLVISLPVRADAAAHALLIGVDSTCRVGGSVAGCCTIDRSAPIFSAPSMLRGLLSS